MRAFGTPSIFGKGRDLSLLNDVLANVLRRKSFKRGMFSVVAGWGSMEGLLIMLWDGDFEITATEKVVLNALSGSGLGKFV